jgi:hypothetical protein
MRRIRNGPAAARPGKSPISSRSPPRLARNTIIEAIFDVGRRFQCTMRIDCGQLDPGYGDPAGTRRMAAAYARAL